MKLKIYRPANLVFSILFLLFAAAVAFEASTNGLSSGINLRGGRSFGSLFVTVKSIFGEFVARYFVSLPFWLVGISLLATAFKPKALKDPSEHNADQLQ